jgi:lysozyme family protein
MASELLPLVGGVGGLTSYITLTEAGVGPGRYAVAVVVAAIFVAVWAYSPLPNRTVFAGMGDPEAGYWGFRRPEDD